ncbi:unnamed protein product [Gongylonema pulchrum]|uniref:RT_RNaseH_2 domain-containing protein n=1 Tax=Gongylonema pulchrum TaxID=637853 RepID=A0A183EGK7_9BILA|nr:unnamed protein product [Gongylonema pulchrum]
MEENLYTDAFLEEVLLKMQPPKPQKVLTSQAIVQMVVLVDGGAVMMCAREHGFVTTGFITVIAVPRVHFASLY